MCKMLRLLSFSACVLAAVFGVQSASAPFIKPCQVTDSACLLASSQAVIPIIAAGLPELGVQSLDPMDLGTVNADQGALKLTFKDTIVEGMKGCTMENLKVNNVKGKMVVQVRCSVVLNGNYKLNGQLLILPVQGQGKYKIKIRDIVIKVVSDLSTVEGADGKPHWQINKWRHSFHVNTNVHFDFENLFNGNKALAGPVLQFANTNWPEVMTEIAPPVVEAIVAKVVDGVKALHKSVPLDELIAN